MAILSPPIKDLSPTTLGPILLDFLQYHPTTPTPLQYQPTNHYNTHNAFHTHPHHPHHPRPRPLQRPRPSAEQVAVRLPLKENHPGPRRLSVAGGERQRRQHPLVQRRIAMHHHPVWLLPLRPPLGRRQRVLDQKRHRVHHRLREPKTINWAAQLEFP
jgi:hypothetical protein